MHKHQSHELSYYMWDVSLEIPVSMTADGNLSMNDPPIIIDSHGNEFVYCSTCKEKLLVGSEDGPKTDWEFV